MSVPLTPQPGGSHRAPAKMPTGSPPDSLAYPNNFPDVLGVPWGTGPNEVADIYFGFGTNRRVLFFLHGGAGVVGDLRQLSMGGTGLGSAIIDYVKLNLLPIDVVSIGYEKAAWLAPTPCAHVPQYSPTSNPTYFPSNVDRLSALWAWAASSAVMYGWSEESWHLGGVSHGGVLAMLARLQNAAPVKTLVLESPLPDYRDPFVWWQVGQGMAAGVLDQIDWEAEPDSSKDSMSAVLQLASNPCPMFLANAAVGNGETPYGSTEGGNVHDVAQAMALDTALSGASIGHELRLYPRAALADRKLGAGIAQAAVEFMLAHP